MNHNIDKAYNYNYLLDASHLYWAARWLELNRSLDEKDRMLDQLIISRLRKAAETITNQSIQGLKQVYDTPNIGKELMEQLASEQIEK